MKFQKKTLSVVFANPIFYNFQDMRKFAKKIVADRTIVSHELAVKLNELLLYVVLFLLAPLETCQISLVVGFVA